MKCVCVVVLIFHRLPAGKAESIRLEMQYVPEVSSEEGGRNALTSGQQLRRMIDAPEQLSSAGFSGRKWRDFGADETDAQGYLLADHDYLESWHNSLIRSDVDRDDYGGGCCGSEDLKTLLDILSIVALALIAIYFAVAVSVSVGRKKREVDSDVDSGKITPLTYASPVTSHWAITESVQLH